MKCREVRKRLSAYLDNEVYDGTEADIDRHLAICHKCQKLRRKLLLSKHFVKKLKGAGPGPAFTPETGYSFRPKESFRPNRRTFLALALILALAVIVPVALFRAALGPSPVALLPQGEEIAFDMASPNMICLAENSWMKLEGEGAISRGKGFVKVDLEDGNVCVVSDEPFSSRIIIKAAGFTITSTTTAFYIKAKSGSVRIELMSGILTVEYQQANKTEAVRLSNGAVAEGSFDGSQYRLDKGWLSERETLRLARRIDEVRKLGLFAQRNPDKKEVMSGNIRIEFWKGKD